jgi:hypothetical protein
MRTPLAFCALVLAPMTLASGALPSRAYAQHAPPPGSYQRQCTNIYMENNLLHATCGGAVSSINVLSCASDIGVDGQGGLVCAGPGAGGPPPRPGPGPGPGPRPPWTPEPQRPPPGGSSRDAVTLFAGPGLRGPSVRIDGPAANLNRSGFNDRVGSIELERRSGPWIVCADANYRGRCVTIRNSVGDTRSLGLSGAISSLRPAR